MGFKTYNITGLCSWAKVIGDPQPNYDETENQWSIDVSLDQRGIDLFTRLGMKDKIKNGDDDRGDYVTLRRKEFKKDGEANKPIEIVDADGNKWDDAKLIGNESKVKVRFSVLETSFKGKKFIKPYPWKITVLELKEYIPKKKKDAPAAKAPVDEKPVRKGVVNNKKKPAAKSTEWQGNDEEGTEE